MAAAERINVFGNIFLLLFQVENAKPRSWEKKKLTEVIASKSSHCN